MSMNDSKWLKITIGKSGRGEPFHLKPLQVPHRGSMAELNWDQASTGTDTYKAQHFFVMHHLQIFWLWFVVSVDFKREKIGEQKYVRYEATHLQAIDEALNPQP